MHAACKQTVLLTHSLILLEKNVVFLVIVIKSAIPTKRAKAVMCSCRCIQDAVTAKEVYTTDSANCPDRCLYAAKLLLETCGVYECFIS